MKKNKKEPKGLKLEFVEYSPIEGFIWYFVEPDRDKAEDFFKEKYEKDYELTGNGLCMNREGKDPVVWMKSRRADIVAHEMIHAVLHLFSLMGIERVNDDNDEMFAYFVDYAVKTVMR